MVGRGHAERLATLPRGADPSRQIHRAGCSGTLAAMVLISDELVSEERISDEELDRLARTADPDVALDDDAVSIWELDHVEGAPPLLPTWYMPAPMAGRAVLRGWRRCVILSVVVTFVVINAYGLCSTYGVVRFG